MQHRAGAGFHAHEADDDAVAFDAGAMGGRIIRAALNFRNGAEIEDVFAVTGANSARRARSGFVGH